MKESSQRELKRCLENLKEIKKQKQILKEFYTRKMNRLNEGRERVSPRMKRLITSEYDKECNEFVDDCREELEQCCNLPELSCCWKGVCDRDGVVYEDCLEEDFDSAVDDAIDTLSWLVIPVKVKC